MSVTINTLKLALIRHRRLSLSLLAFNILMAATDLGGLLSISGAIQMLSHPDVPYRLAVLERLNIQMPVVSIHGLLGLVVLFQMVVSLCQWKRADLMSKLRSELFSWWSRDLLHTFAKSSWSVASQYKEVQLSHLISFDIERMGVVFFLALRMLSALMIFAGYSIILSIFFETKLLVMLSFLILSLVLIKRFLPNPRASGEALGEESEQLDRCLTHIFKGYKSLALPGQHQWRQAEKDIIQQELVWRSAYLLMIRSQTIQHIFSLLFVGLTISLCIIFTSIGLDQIAIMAYLYYRLNPLGQQLLRDSQEWRQSEPSFKKAIEILNHLKAHPRKEGQLKLSEPIKDFSVENLRFTHLKATVPCFKNLNFHARQGQVVLITGHNGRGKSTLADVICRLLQADEGTIFANGKAHEDYTLESWGQQVAYLPQESFLVRGSILKNCFWEENPGEQHWQRLRSHSLAHWLPQSQEALESELHENDARLSGGTHRKICVLRTLMSQASLFVLDEPTEHLDAQCRQDFVNAIQHQKKSAIWLIFSHDPVCRELADIVVDLEPEAQV
jgi:ATP-binding cassette, subfamily C, bacterial